VQLLVGGRLEREGINAKLLSLMALITLAVAPVALLLFLQIKFLPYHSEPITWLHRGLLALDLALVWTLWPGYRSGWGVRLWPKVSWWLVVPGIGSAAALAYAAMVATFPDERMYLATNLDSGEKPDWYASITPVNTLDLYGEDLIDDTKLAHIIEKNEGSTDSQRWVATLPLEGRDLTGADLSKADVRHVDFSHAILKRANLIDAWAEKARFDHAQLQGASLIAAQLQGASLNRAQLQGALLDDAQLQGATLEDAQLQGASLNDAHVQATSFMYAQLQGASLNRAQLQGASFVDVCVWRADARQAAWEETRVVHPDHECYWTAASFAEFRQLIAVKVAEGYFIRPLRTIERTLDPTKALEGEEKMAEDWAEHERSSPAPEVYAKSLAEQWGKTGCAADGAPYVLQALLNRLGDAGISPFAADSPETPKLAAAFLDKDCAGARGLSEGEIAKLASIRDRAPPAPKP
jgi:Pentapeptide repeats (8 copies)